MDELVIKKYLEEKYGLFSFEIKKYVKMLKKHPDILAEFADYARTGEYKTTGAVISAGWTAKALSEELSHISVLGIYKFMVGLRDNPKDYKQYVAEGAPIK